MAMEKTFDAKQAEARLYAAWEDSGAFKAGANARDGASPFCILLPPPNVTGTLHMGHAFNHTLMDILTRWHRMKGDDTLWQPGLDHAGIATQMVVERELAAAGGPGRTALGREAFTRKVWEWKEKSGGRIVEQDKALGASMDWDRLAFTMAGAPGGGEDHAGPNFHDAVIKVFVDMYHKGLIYRGKRLVNWDPHFETAISDLEVENIEKPGHMWHFKYPLAGGETYEYVEKDEDGTITLRETRDYISIATTRPETMLGDGAVAVHPSDERYAPIVGKLCEIPVGPKEHRRLIPIITDSYPDPDFGSGAVKITGAHDFNDYEVAKRGGIPMYRLMDTKGALRSDGAPYAEEAVKAQAIVDGADFTVQSVDAINLVPDEYRGLDRFEARQRVVDDITSEGLAVMIEVPDQVRDGSEEKPAPGEDPGPLLEPYVENKPIMQPFGDRSKVVIEPMLTDQWFVDTAKIVQPAIDAVRNGDTQILPEQHEKVYMHWLENIEPWTISRQLWWGHQIPVWFDADGNEYCAATEAEAQALAPGKTLTRDPDVLDTWFSSGLWPIGTMGWPEDTAEMEKYFPSTVLITGFDIIFFWVARMMMMQYAVVDQKPFDTVYVHALVRDEKGKKMSKSLGNVVDPMDLIEEFGADAVRFNMAAMAGIGRDLKLSVPRIAGYRNFGTKLWNATRFAEMNGVLDAPRGTTPAPSQTVNKWILGEVGQVRSDVDAALEAFRFNDAASALYAFVWGTVCDWYIELSKPLLQGDDGPEKDETRETMAWVLDQCFTLLHPFMPFVTEELWGTTAQRGNLLVVEDWPTYGPELLDADAGAEMRWVISLIEGIRSARAQMNVPAGAKIPVLAQGLDDAAQLALGRNLDLIKRMARVESVSDVDAMPKGTITVAVSAATFGLPLADIIDVDAEQARLEKSLGKLEKEIKGLTGRLGNPKFAQSAPPEVVEEAQANLDARTQDADKLREALSRLAEI